MAQDSIPAVPAVGAPGALRLWTVAWTDSLRAAWRALWVSRLVVWGAGVAAVLIWGTSSRARDYDPLGLVSPFGHTADVLVAPGARWDSVWYLTIAHDGYGADRLRPAFFPLYPVLLKGGGWVLGSPLVAGVILSVACFGAALVIFHRLTALELGSDAAGHAVTALALFPGSLFFSAVYSEALFLALSVGAVYAARTGRWGYAGGLGALATATRSAGLVLLVPLALLWWSRSRRGRDAAWLALVPMGAAVFCLALAGAGHDGLAPFHAQEAWYRSFAGPFVGAWDGTVAAFDGARQLLSGSRTPVYFTAAGGDPFLVARHNLFLFAFLVAVVPAVVGVARRLPVAYVAYLVAALALPLSWPVGPQPLMSLPRFEAVLFPLFMWLGWWAARSRRRALVLHGALAVALAACSAQFATWHWFA